MKKENKIIKSISKIFGISAAALLAACQKEEVQTLDENEVHKLAEELTASVSNQHLIDVREKAEKEREAKKKKELEAKKKKEAEKKAKEKAKAEEKAKLQEAMNQEQVANNTNNVSNQQVSGGGSTNTQQAPQNNSQGSQQTQPKPQQKPQGNGTYYSADGFWTGNAKADAALAWVGNGSRCTDVAESALNAVGKTGWAEETFESGGMEITSKSLTTETIAASGTPVGSMAVGDILFYNDGGSGSSHVAVFIGNGLAVHGGWQGFQTVITSVNIGSGVSHIIRY